MDNTASESPAVSNLYVLFSAACETIHERPPPLSHAGSAVEPSRVLLQFAPVGILDNRFIREELAMFTLALQTDPFPTDQARRVDKVRSKDRLLSTPQFQALRCHFSPTESLVPGLRPGPEDSCLEDARPWVHELLDDLRSQAGAAGCNAVLDVKCRATPSDRLWCSGEAAVLPDLRSGEQEIRAETQWDGFPFGIGGGASVGWNRGMLSSTALYLQKSFIELKLDLPLWVFGNAAHVGIGAQLGVLYPLRESRWRTVATLGVLGSAPMNPDSVPGGGTTFRPMLGIDYRFPLPSSSTTMFFRPSIGWAVGGGALTGFVGQLDVGLMIPER